MRPVDERAEPTSRWAADASAFDRWFDRPWGSYASRVEHGLLLDAIDPVDGLDVCDAGCGTGRFAARLEAGGARAVAVDRDPSELVVAGTRVRGGLVVADVHDLPFADGTFDAAIAVTVCEFASDPAEVIAELVRITRPGGRVVIGSLQRNSPWGWWSRRQFDAPPWNTARFLDRDELDAIARRHGRTTWTRGLYAPAALPGIWRWGPLLERIGGLLARRHGAFEVLTIDMLEFHRDPVHSPPIVGTESTGLTPP